jgi:hypothetical protein
VENAEDEGEGEEEEKWLAVKTTEASDELLSIVHVNNGECRRQRRRRRGRGRGRGRAVVVPSRRRLVVS